jgi:lipopolysaccharide transport system ATP-binding protein
MTMPAISVQGLSKSYRLGKSQERSSYRTLRESLGEIITYPFRKRVPVEDFLALNDISFDVQPGEVMGIIGRNGAGKSTLLKILSRITRPTRGRVEINGRVGSLLEVGTGFHPELTGRENIYLNGSILGMSRKEIERKFDEIVAFAEIEQFLDTPVKRYSSGMYVRLAFAVAAHLEPEILIVDEVLAVGDAAFQKKCLGKMGEVARGGRTILFVSHNMPTIKSLCTWGVMLSNGRICQAGSIEQVVEGYLADGLESNVQELNRNRRIASSKEATILDAWISSEGLRTNIIDWDKQFSIHMEIDVVKSVLLSPEYLIRDCNQVPILFAPTGLFQGYRQRLEPGRYQICSRCPKLALASGKYFIDLMICESNQRFYDYYECGLSFQVEELPRPPHGWVFRQGRGQGSLPLEVEVAISKHE